MPVKPLSFKGDKKTSKKRKLHETSSGERLDVTSIQPTHIPIHPDEDDSWTSPSTAADLTGPALIILPTVPPTCLASDANGRLFASPLENMVEDVPRTAEPHDVRQVWVATKVPGTSTGAQEGEVGFKGAHGGWLSCDSVGVLGAVREARGMEEGFILEPARQDEDSRSSAWLLRTAASKKSEGDKGRKYICAPTQPSPGSSTMTKLETEDDERKPRKISIALRGDGEADDQSSRLIIRMQARFLPRSAAVVAHQKSKEKVTRQELEKVVGRKLDEEQVRKLKRAKRQGTYHEEVLDMRAKGSHDKFA